MTAGTQSIPDALSHGSNEPACVVSSAGETVALPPRLRVLLSAYATSPYRGSEPGVGWNIAKELAAHHDVTVLCNRGENNKDSIAYERHLKEEGPVPGLTVHYVERPFLTRHLQVERSWRRPFYYIGYNAWQKAAFRDARRLHAAQPFDIAHHLNFIGYREPGYLWRMELPFAWGPLGGAAMMPWPYMSMFTWKDRAFFTVRNLLNAWQMRTRSRCRHAAAAADHIWAADKPNIEMVGRYFGQKCEQMVESGTTPISHVTPRDYPGDRPLRLVWSGWHQARKGLPLLLHSLASMAKESRPIELCVLGDGVENARWKRLATQLGIDYQIDWTGMIPHGQAVEKMARADALVLTSLQEGTPHVVTEALSEGVPVLCHDACGMGMAVDETCGIKVQMRDIPTSVAGFAQAIRRLGDEAGFVNSLSRGAIARSETLSWVNKAARMAEVYRTIQRRVPNREAVSHAS